MSFFVGDFKSIGNSTNEFSCRQKHQQNIHAKKENLTTIFLMTNPLANITD
jgi:hypothetical protein